MLKTKLKEQQQVEEGLVPQELVQKFDGDKQLVEEFLDQGYTIEELQGSTITHPTKFDPVCTLEDGITQAGMWLYSNNNHNTNNRIKYTNSTF